MPKQITHLIGKTWDEFDFEALGGQDESNEPPEDEDDQSTNTSEVMEELIRIPENLSSLFGRYPMDEDFMVTSCNFCKRILKNTHKGNHVHECEIIPQALKDILMNKSLVKSKEDNARVAGTSTGGHTQRLTTHSRPSTSHSSSSDSKQAQPQKSIPSSTITSAPSSPANSSSSSINQPLATINPITVSSVNYSLPIIKIEKSDSFVPGEGKSKPMIGSSILKSKKLLVVPQSLKIKPSVVLKIKGNTSTTTTMTAGKITLHAVTSQPSSPSLSTEIIQSGKSPTGVLTSSTPTTQLPQSVEEPPLSNVMTTSPLGMIPTKASLKTIDIDGISPAGKRKKLGEDARKIIPLRDRRFNPNEHCGVINSDGSQCKRSLTCKTHSMGLRRAVPGRSHPFDMLLVTQKKERDKAKLAKQETFSPASPLVGLSPIVVSSVSSGDGSSDALKLSLPVSSSTVSMSSTQSHNLQIGSQNPSLLNLLGSNTFFGEGNGGVPSSNSVLVSASPLRTTTLAPAGKRRLKNNHVKRNKEIENLGIKLQLIPREPLGFDCVTQLIPPDEECMTSSTEMTLYEKLPFVDGRNILLIDDEEEEIAYVPHPLTPIFLGRRKKRRWRRSSSQFILRQVLDEKIMNKKLRREINSMERLSLMLGEGDWGNEPLSDTITLTRGDDFEGYGEMDITPTTQLSSSSQTSKVSFRLHPKQICRPTRAEKPYATQEMNVHTGPLVEMTQALNGLGIDHVVGGNQTFGTYESMEVNFEVKGSDPTCPTLQHSQEITLKTFEDNEQNWTMEQRRNRDVDAPVADSELSKLLAAQFEDY